MNKIFRNTILSDRPIEEKALLILLLMSLLATFYSVLRNIYTVDILATLTASGFVAIIFAMLFAYMRNIIDKQFLSILFIVIAFPLFLIGFILTPSSIEATIYLVLFPFVTVVLLPSAMATSITALFLTFFYAIDYFEIAHAVLTRFEIASLMFVIIFTSLFLGFYVRFTRNNQENLLKRQAMLEKRVKERTLELEQLNTQLKKEATTDYLTGIANREVLFTFLNKEIERYNRYKTPTSVIIFDIDHFKRINDTFGHGVGDDVLKKMARSAKEHIRNIDLLVRYGGEEFVVVCPNATVEVAVIVAEKLRVMFEKSSFIENYTVTASFGVASMQEECSQDRLIDRADKKLYLAKNEGRNRVCH